MENNIETDIVADEETVIRYLKRRYYDKIEEQWSTDAFELRQGEDCISVCRENLLDSIEDGVNLSFPERMWKSIIAYTSLGVGNIRTLSSEEMKVDVIPTATEINPSHAGIIAAANDNVIVGVPTSPAYYNLQGKLLELAVPNIRAFNIQEEINKTKTTT